MSGARRADAALLSDAAALRRAADAHAHRHRRRARRRGRGTLWLRAAVRTARRSARTAI